jgi:uncharacterized protein
MSSTLHPDGKLNPSHTVANDSANPSINELIEQRLISRRDFLKTTAGASALAVLGTGVVDGMTNYAEATPAPVGSIGFTSVPANIIPMTDKVSVPAGYTAEVLVAWGDSLTAAAHWDTVSPMDEATQSHCYGAHTDGMHLFPFPGVGVSGLSNSRGLLVSNSEYCDPALVHGIVPASSYATATITQAMVNTQLAAHGVNVVEVEKKNGAWSVKRPSGFNRRITGMSRCTVSGPAAGHALLKTGADSSGKQVMGTLNNCAHGYTPWGTYLTCEENFNGYFGANTTFAPTPLESRYGLSAGGFGYRWHVADPRFDLNANRNEPNRFGWVVEIDPFNPKAVPIKRTALGRFKHEAATVVVDNANNVAVYMGDDERFDYVYKFVCADKYNAKNRAANRDLLDSGVLHVARFNADGTGQWIPLLPSTLGTNGQALRDHANFSGANDADVQARILIYARAAADAVGATKMDRPEWTTVHPVTGEVYLTLTNNTARTAAQVDAANPRPSNTHGHIIRWLDRSANVTATQFDWDIFVQCGDKLDANVNRQGNIIGDDYGSPDGLWFDRDGRLWIETDQAGNATGAYANIGGNVMMCADPSTGLTKRFLTSPPNSEVTGVTTTPDGRTMFVGIQHPGEDWSLNMTQNSTWPDNGANGNTTFTGSFVARPRSGIVVITKDDGGVIGS